MDYKAGSRGDSNGSDSSNRSSEVQLLDYRLLALRQRCTLLIKAGAPDELLHNNNQNETDESEKKLSKLYGNIPANKILSHKLAVLCISKQRIENTLTVAIMPCRKQERTCLALDRSIPPQTKFPIPIQTLSMCHSSPQNAM
jgi:hypothetical protein